MKKGYINTQSRVNELTKKKRLIGGENEKEKKERKEKN